MNYKSRGVALIQVLFMTAIMSVIAIQFTKTARNQVSIAQDFNNRVQAELLLRSAKSRVLFNLFKHDANQLSDAVVDGIKWNLRGVPFDFGEGVKLKVTSASAYLSLISAPKEYIKKVLISNGADESQAAEIYDSLKDWIDADNVTSPNGAEDNFYRSKGLKVRNGPLQHISELMSLKGMTLELYKKVRPFFTIHMTQSASPALMSPELASMIFTQDVAEQIQQAQLQNNFNESTWRGLVGSREYEYIDIYPGSIFTIEVTSYYHDVRLTETFDVKVNSQKAKQPISIIGNY